MEIGIAIDDIVMTQWIAAGPFNPEDKDQLKLTLDTNISFHQKERAVVVVNSLKYYYEKEPKTFILESTFLSRFLLELDLEFLNKDGSMNIPDQACITMISIGISHARAMFFSQARSLGLQGFMLPLVNPTEIFKRIKKNLQDRVSDQTLDF